jgi:hypothetical protein
MIDHADIRERLELAAVEPGGLERLAAGDTPEAAFVAGHLAGCPSCAEEARRLATIGTAARQAATEIPPDALRERTLALVRAVGRPRRASTTNAPAPAVASTTPAPVPLPRRRFGWPAAIAAALALALVTGGGLFAVRQTQQLESQAEALAELSAATIEVTGRPDVLRVTLTAPASGTTRTGTILFSPSTAELIVSAPGLTQPADGQALACWVTRRDGSRVRMGQMEFGGGIAYWAGWSDDLKAAGPGTTFGVTLIGADGTPVGPGDVLSGTVGQS